MVDHGVTKISLPPLYNPRKNPYRGFSMVSFVMVCVNEASEFSNRSTHCPGDYVTTTTTATRTAKKQEV